MKPTEKITSTQGAVTTLPCRCFFKGDIFYIASDCALHQEYGEDE